jgi:molybdopterin synthase sulfur carrier subunit
MSLTVRIPTPLRKFTGDQADVEASGGTVGKVLDNLEAQFPGIKENLVDADSGALRRFVNVYVNEEDVRFLDGTDTELKDGDSVAIVPAIAGGCTPIVAQA